MSASISRLTLYALIVAIEADLRAMLTVYAPDQTRPIAIFGDDMFKKVAERAQRDTVGVRQIANFNELIAYCDFGDLLQLARKFLTSLPDSYREQLKAQHAAFDHLIGTRNRVMHSRPLEFDDLSRTTDLCERLLVTFREWPELYSTIDLLKTSPEFVLRLTIPPSPEIAATSHNLPMPDFDETGFIGRKDILKNLLKAAKGAYPVITLVGEGGLGKTSLALKVAYDLLDVSPNPYDAIIFVTAKTSQLTVTEIRRIEGAINSSIGLMQSALSSFGGGELNPLQELVTLLSNFKIFLIIDNLETILDSNIRKLLEDLPEGSKVLITSRIGLGAYEYPIQLQPLVQGEAVQLLRATAHVRECKKLVEMSTERLGAYCARMRNNPLHIKWFVSAVQAGKRPEEVLADERLFLQFCLANVFDKISDDARRLVRTLLSVGGGFTVAELSFLTEMTETDLLRAVQELMRTNMFFMTSMSFGSTFETKYELSQLARAYLNKFYPVNKDEQKRLLALKQKLVSAGEQLASEAVRNPLSAFTIHCRTRSDWVVAKYLRDALSASKNGDHDLALAAIEIARSLAPDFFEVYRVDAWVNAAIGNISYAFDEYEKAVELCPESANTRMLYGGFLLRDVHDTEAAISQFKSIVEVHPELIEPKIELARCYLYTRKFEETEAILDSFSAASNISERSSRKTQDLRLQLYVRKADFYCTSLEPLKSISELTHAREYYDSVEHTDARMMSRLEKTRLTVTSLRSQVWENPDSLRKISDYMDWLGQLALKMPEAVAETVASSTGSLDLRAHGKIVRMNASGKFGFIRSDGLEIFFHISNVSDQNDLQSIVPGTAVSFAISIDWLNRQVAINIQKE